MIEPQKDLQCCTSQCDNPLDKTYWNTKWENKQTTWDIGHASPAIVDYITTLPNKNIRILIPGCGNAYEAEILLKNGFTNITLIDIAPKSVEILQEKFKNQPQIHISCQDFFEHQGAYDLMIEQTFFCAIPPSKREDYAKKAHEILHPNGKIIGLLFDRTFEQGPPFGGCPCQYRPIFEPLFNILQMDVCKNSIPPRADQEVFIEFIKK